MTTLNWIALWWTAAPKQEPGHQLEDLRARLLGGGELDDLRAEVRAAGREGVELLASLRRQGSLESESAQQLFFLALREYLLTNDVIGPEMTAWLRHVLPVAEVGPAERAFLTEVHTRARRVCPEFQRLLDECVRR